jgi:hypothetical protein
MSRVGILLIFMLLTRISVNDASYSTIAEAFFNSLKSGDYSVLKPCLDEDMVKVFSEERFKAFRNDILSKYGFIKDYKFIREEESGGFILSYYSFNFERANVTFRLVVRRVDDEYRLSGLWIHEVNMGEKGVSIPIAIILTMLGGFLGFLMFYLMMFRVRGKEFLLGFLLVLVVIIIQPIIQQAPFQALNIKSSIDILARGVIYIVLASLWIGFVAGFLQEGLKYLTCRGRDLGSALFIGVGFGVGEAVLIPILQSIQLAVLGSLHEVSLLNSILSMIERFLVTVFHAGTAIILAYSYRKGFGWKAFTILSITHGVIDTSASYYQLTTSPTSLTLSYILLMASASIMLYYGIPKAKLNSKAK